MVILEKNITSIKNIIPSNFLSTINTIQQYNDMSFNYEKNDDDTSTIKFNVVWTDSDGDKKLYKKYHEKEVIPQIISNNSSAYLLLLDDRIVKESDYYKEIEKDNRKKHLKEKNNILFDKNFSQLSLRDTIRSEQEIFNEYIQCDECGDNCLPKNIKVFGICDHVCCNNCLNKINIVAKELYLPNLIQCPTKECLVSSILPSINDTKIFKKYCKYYAAGKYDKILKYYKNSN
ncbi:Hypothetical protein SRAE_2000466100 [Strongyloides ratti]|uniref:RING-type domain-containing protein n=1 Tax=Strongyloides ratti TaxID=34506 RepID=A0A090LP96_STRRB|nr:Hypothetical protein SRAE_2000466100 [Strongyloides ratti]CEF70019.1 Hypothetical protein SRAE_2000466100 [Strongyloides ratti]